MTIEILSSKTIPLTINIDFSIPNVSSVLQKYGNDLLDYSNILLKAMEKIGAISKHKITPGDYRKNVGYLGSVGSQSELTCFFKYMDSISLNNSVIDNESILNLIDSHTDYYHEASNQLICNPRLVTKTFKTMPSMKFSVGGRTSFTESNNTLHIESQITCITLLDCKIPYDYQKSVVNDFSQYINW